jgi:hypothetical protein
LEFVGGIVMDNQKRVGFENIRRSRIRMDGKNNITREITAARLGEIKISKLK